MTIQEAITASNTTNAMFRKVWKIHPGDTYPFITPTTSQLYIQINDNVTRVFVLGVVDIMADDWEVQ